MHGCPCGFAGDPVKECRCVPAAIQRYQKRISGPLLDGYAVTVAERSGGSYGGLRVWGSVGYTVAARAVGWLMGDEVSRLALVACSLCVGVGLPAVPGLPTLGERTSRPLLGGLRVL